MPLTSADATMAAALAETLSELTLVDADAAVVRLAKKYAAAIDEDPDVLEKIGPKLLSCLEALGATPRARAALRKGGEPSRVESRLAVLRAARAN